MELDPIGVVVATKSMTNSVSFKWKLGKTPLMVKKQKCNPQFASMATLDGSTAVLYASGDQRSITTSQLSFALHLLHAHALRADSWSLA